MRKTKIISLFMSLAMTFSLVFTSANYTFADENKEATKKITASETFKDFKKDEVYEGFKLVDKVVNAAGDYEYLFKHEKSGANLFYINNGSPTLSFGIGFKTPVKNDKGIPHVLEHSFFAAGSKKYPATEINNELSNRVIGLNVNGYTYTDCTFYPFSTINENDFTKVMDVYMDMIYNPGFIGNEKAFKQEAWRYDYDEKKDELRYNGVVLNEMEGNMYDLSSMIYNAEMKSLFPDTCYKYVSGGKVDSIVTLTQEEVESFYKKFYKPSNSYTVIAGNLNILDKLKDLNENYYSKYEDDNVEIKIPTQEKMSKIKDIKLSYPLADSENLEGRTILSMNYLINDELSQTEEFLLSVMHNHLFLSNSSAMSAFGKLTGISYSSSIIKEQKQPYITIRVLNGDEEYNDQVVDAINEILETVIDEGFDHESLLSYLNTIELNSSLHDYKSNSSESLRDGNFINWIRDGSPLDDSGFKSPKDFYAEIRKMIKNGKAEDIAEKYLINNKNTSVVKLVPKHGLISYREKAIKNKLNRIKSTLSEKELEALKEESKAISAWINQENSKEVLDKLPKSNFKEFSMLNYSKPTIEKIGSSQILKHTIDTDELAKIKLYFDASSIAKDDLVYLTLFSELMGKLNAGEKTFVDVEKDILKLTSGLKFDIITMPKNGDVNNPVPYFTVETECLTKNTEEVFELIENILLNSDFFEGFTTYFSLGNIAQTLKMSFENNPTSLAAIENEAGINARSSLVASIKGMRFKDFTSDMFKNYQTKFEACAYELDSIKSIFSKYGLSASVAVSEKNYPEMKKELTKFRNSLKTSKSKAKDYKYELEATKTAFTTQTAQNINIQSFNYNDFDVEFNGEMNVLAEIISSKFLWENIRLEGGSYGANMHITSSGVVSLISYSDSQIENTYATFEKIPDFIRNLELTDEELENFKLTTLSSFLSNTSVFEGINIGDSLYLTKRPSDFFDKIMTEILETDVESLKKYADMIEKGLAQKNLTTVSNQTIVEENLDFFDKIINLNE